jgi:hypothetical protein
MRVVGMSFVIAVLAGACDPSPAQQGRDVCTALCDCTSASPSRVNACIEECVMDVPATLPQACVDCVYQYSQTCGDLFEQCIESDLCDSQQPQPNLPRRGGTR